MPSISARLLSGLLLALPAGPAPAAEPEPEPMHGHATPHRSRAIGFDEAVGASEQSPALQQLDAAIEHKRRDDGSLPRLSQNPQLQLMPGARLPPASEAGFELQATVSQGWNLGGYGRQRKQAARAETEVLAAEARALAMEHRLGAAEAWIRLYAAERALAIAGQEQATLEELVAVLERAQAEGVVTRVDVAEARTQVAGAEATVTALTGDVHDLGLLLARETGERTPSPLRTRGAPPDPPLPSEPELRQRFAALDDLPEVALRRLRARAALARAREATASRGTQLTTGASMQFESNRDVLLFGVVGATIPVFDRNQRDASTARTEARRHDAEAEFVGLELSARLQVALHDLHHTEEQVAALRDHTLPALDELVAARDLALELGEGTRAWLLRARRQRSEAERALAGAEAERTLARVQVWLYLQAIAAAEDRR